MEMDEEKEKRSSILKLKKPRNPLGEIEVQYEEEDFTTVRKRRVSFASSNQIKKFSTDEHKNTVWDSTYEECIEGSENSPSTLNCQDANKSIITTIKENVEINISKISLHHILDNDDMEFTPPIGSFSSVIKEQFLNNEEYREITMEFTKAITSNNCFTTQTGENSLVPCHDEIDMEFTSILQSDLYDVSTANELTSLGSAEMSYTKPISHDMKIYDDIQSKELCNLDLSGDMEFTTALTNQQLIIRPQNNTIENISISTLNKTEEKINDMQCNENLRTISQNMKVCDNIENKELCNPDLSTGNINNVDMSVSTGDMDFTTALINQQFTSEPQNVIMENISIRTLNKIEEKLNDTQCNENLTTISQNMKICDDIENKEFINDVDMSISTVDMELTTASTNQQFNSELQNDVINKNKDKANDIQCNQDYINFQHDVDENTSSRDVDFTTVINELHRSTVKHNKKSNDCQNDVILAIPTPLTIDDLQIQQVASNNSHQDTDKFKLASSIDLSLTSILPISLENMTSIDDTQQLIDYRLSGKSHIKSDLSRVVAGDLDPSFSKLCHMPLSDNNLNSFHVSVLKPHQNIANSLLETECNNRTSCSVQETFIGKKGEDSIDMSFECDLYHTQPPENLHESTSFTNVSIDSNPPFQQLEVLINKLASSPIDPIKPNRIKELQKKLTNLVTKTIEKFEKVVEELNNSNAGLNSSDTGGNQADENYDLGSDTEAEKSIDVKIRNLEKNNKDYWQLLSVDNVTYKFATFFHTVILTVQLEENSEKVKMIDIENNMKGTREPEARYVHKLFCDKLSSGCIEAALGKRYDIRSLLDYLQVTMQKLLSFLQEYDWLFETYDMMMDQNFMLDFCVVKVDLMLTWNFTLNMLELEPISDKTVKYCAKIGSINHRKIQQCIEACPTGLSFVKAFAENIYDLIDRMRHA